MLGPAALLRPPSPSFALSSPACIVEAVTLDATTRRVTWRHDDDMVAQEWCTLVIRDAGLSFVGTVVGAVGGRPLRVEYRVLAAPDGPTTAAHVRQWHGFELRTLTLVRDQNGGWMVDGSRVGGLRGAADVDLGLGPATNTLPIRRLRLPVGGSRRVTVAWVRFPELTVERAAQTYTRLDGLTYRFESGSVSAELAVDEEGLVVAYTGWRRTGIAYGPDDAEALDAFR